MELVVFIWSGRDNGGGSYRENCRIVLGGKKSMEGGGKDAKGSV